MMVFHQEVNTQCFQTQTHKYQNKIHTLLIDIICESICLYLLHLKIDIEIDLKLRFEID
jgi:hypothetical protein